MNKTNVVSGAAFVALAAAFMIGSYGYGIGYANIDNVPEAGFFPFYLGLVVLVLGAVLMIQGLTGGGSGGASFAMDGEQRKNLRTFFLTLGALVACLAIWNIPIPTLLFERNLTSFEPAALFLCVALNVIYKRSWLFTVLFSVFVVLLIHLLFVRVLSISFEI